MNVIECAEQLRSSGFEVYTWRPHKGTVEPDLIARRFGQLYNVYLVEDESKKKEILDYAFAQHAHVLFAR